MNIPEVVIINMKVKYLDKIKMKINERVNNEEITEYNKEDKSEFENRVE